MKVIFGSYIEVIIDPHMDLGETVGIVCALMYEACCFDFSAAPSLSAVGDQVCVLWLSTTHNDSQVGSGSFNAPDNQERASSHFGVSKTSSFSPALILVPSGVACVVGSLFSG